MYEKYYNNRKKSFNERIGEVLQVVSFFGGLAAASYFITRCIMKIVQKFGE